MKRFIYTILLLLGCAGTAFGGFWLASHKMTVPVEQFQPTNAPVAAAEPASPAAAVTSPDDGVDDEEPDVTKVTFSAGGDNLINAYLYGQAKGRGKNGKYDFSFCYDKVKDFFKDIDLNWLNQETLVSDTLPPSSFPKFSSPGDVARAAYDAGFRVFNLSTNHTYDQGAEGLSATEEFWKSMPDDVLTSGLVKKNKLNKIPIKKVNGVNIAFLSYTYGTNGLPTPEDSKTRVIFLNELSVIKKQVKLARKKADVVVVSCHWGNEDRHEITESQRSLAKKLTGWGADLIIGTHPHVVQNAGWVKSKGRKAFCAYSLGNFLSAQSKVDNLIGAVLSLTFEVREDMLKETKTVTIKDPKLIPIVTDYRAGFQNVRVYWLKDYKKKLADTHGIRSMKPSFSMEYINDVLKSTVNKKYLELPKKKK